MKRRWEWIFIVAAIAAKLWLVEVRELEAHGWLIYDDYWFLQKAQSIRSGEWLGPYDHMTLIKGQGYPLWIALVSSLGISLLLAEHLLYALACLAVCRALTPAVPSPAARAALFVMVLFNPMSFADHIATRTIREAFYASMSVFVFAGAAGAALRLGARWREVWPWLLLNGLALTVFWHTREEGVWILPMLAGAAAAMVRWAFVDWKSRWRAALRVLAIPAIVFAAGHAAIVLANGLRYGVFETVEFKQKSFVRAYASLTHVAHHRPVPSVPVPREVRHRVYAVSPAFAELRTSLEAATPDIDPGGRKEIGGGGFMWTLRQAVASAGYYARGPKAVMDFYDRLSAEIAAARLQGRLDARPPRITLVPPLRRGEKIVALRSCLRGLIGVATFAGFSVSRAVSIGTEEELRNFAAITHSRLAPRDQSMTQIRLRGWVVHVKGALDITIEDENSRPVPGAHVARLPSPDLYEHLARRWRPFPPARHARFDIRVPAEKAFMVISLRGRRIERMMLGSQSPMSFDQNVRMSVDEYRIETVPAPDPPLRAARMNVLRWIGRAYQTIAPFLLTVALVVGSVGFAWRKDWTIAFLIAGLLAAVTARGLILALIEVTSFKALLPTYQAPMYPLMLIAGFLLAHAGIEATRYRWHRTK